MASVFCLSEVYFFFEDDSLEQLNYEEICSQLSRCNDYGTEWLIVGVLNSVPVRGKSFFSVLYSHMWEWLNETFLCTCRSYKLELIDFPVWVLKGLFTGTSINSLIMNVHGYISYSTAIRSCLLCQMYVPCITFYCKADYLEYRSL
jgi:hypothetical protein